MFDANFFLKALAWFFAIGATLSTILQLFFLWWSTNTMAGKLEALRDRLHHKRVYHFSFKPMIIAIIGWIAVFSFR